MNVLIILAKMELLVSICKMNSGKEIIRIAVLYKLFNAEV